MKKRNLFLAGILALGLVFTLVLTGCPEVDEGYYTDPYYIGTWTQDGGSWEIEITETELTFKVSATNYFTVEYSQDWIALDNGTAPYENGYKIVGYVTDRGTTSTTAFKVDGTTKSDSIATNLDEYVAIYYYINTGLDKLVGGDPEGSDDSNKYSKKTE